MQSHLDLGQYLEARTGISEFPPCIPRLSQASFYLKMLVIDETMIFISFLTYEPVAQRQESTNGREVALVFQSLCSDLAGGTQGKTAETCKNSTPSVDPIHAAAAHKASI